MPAAAQTVQGTTTTPAHEGLIGEQKPVDILPNLQKDDNESTFNSFDEFN